MKTKLPIKKLIKIALLTTPFFGLFAAAPGLTFKLISFDRIVSGFLLTSVITVLLWGINIYLLSLSFKYSFFGKRWLRFLCGVVVISFMLVILFYIMPPPPIGQLPNKLELPLPPIGIIFFPFIQILSSDIIIFILIELLVLQDVKIRVDMENQELKLANLEAKNISLREQLHPHFLFNSLSTLRSLIIRSPQLAEEYLERLSELLRFSTTQARNVLVYIKDETELCANYLEMQKVRFTEALSFNIDIPEYIRENAKVPVYSIQHLIENAIKHNILTKDIPLNIVIRYNSDQERIEVSNTLNPKKQITKTSGTGLNNLRERYQLLGIDNVDIYEGEGCFSVSIKIIKS